MDVTLTPELEKLIQERLKTGRYGSAAELVREALRLYFNVEELNRRIDEGLGQLDRGEGIGGAESLQCVLARTCLS